jgi:hypothetical protein
MQTIQYTDSTQRLRSTLSVRSALLEQRGSRAVCSGHVHPVAEKVLTTAAASVLTKGHLRAQQLTRFSYSITGRACDSACMSVPQRKPLMQPMTLHACLRHDIKRSCNTRRWHHPRVYTFMRTMQPRVQQPRCMACGLEHGHGTLQEVAYLWAAAESSLLLRCAVLAVLGWREVQSAGQPEGAVSCVAAAVHTGACSASERAICSADGKLILLWRDQNLPCAYALRPADLLRLGQHCSGTTI